MRLSMEPSTRCVLICKYCDQEISPLPHSQLPVNIETGQEDVVACLRMHICPCCLTESGMSFTLDQAKRMLARRRRQAAARRQSC